jgi:[acyl-carrier-protein] S-malonyltransferase
VTAGPVMQAGDAQSLLLRQLTSPVRWTDVVGYLADQYPAALFVEMGPGSVLTGLMKRIAPTVATATCGTAAEVEQLLARVA